MCWSLDMLGGPRFPGIRLFGCKDTQIGIGLRLSVSCLLCIIICIAVSCVLCKLLSPSSSTVLDTRALASCCSIWQLVKSSMARRGLEAAGKIGQQAEGRSGLDLRSVASISMGTMTNLASPFSTLSYIGESRTGLGPRAGDKRMYFCRSLLLTDFPDKAVVPSESLLYSSPLLAIGKVGFPFVLL